MAAPQKVIVTAEEWQKRLLKSQTTRSKEEREFRRKSQEHSALLDMRDAAVGYLKAAGITAEGSEERGGPVAATIKAWDKGLVKEPRTMTFLKIAKITGRSFGFY